MRNGLEHSRKTLGVAAEKTLQPGDLARSEEMLEILAVRMRMPRPIEAYVPGQKPCAWKFIRFALPFVEVGCALGMHPNRRFPDEGCRTSQDV